MGLEASPGTKAGPKRAWVRVAGATPLIGVLLIGLVLRYGGETLVVTTGADDPGVIVVLASHESERLPVAAALARRYESATVLLTVPSSLTAHNCDNCRERVAWLVKAGIDPARVTVLPQLVDNTYDEARAAAVFAARHDVERLAIVTSPYHARRALATFRHLFSSAQLGTEIGIAIPLSGVDPAYWWLRDYDQDYVAYEWAAIIYYALRFGVSPFL